MTHACPTWLSYSDTVCFLGSFEWEGENFAESAEDISFAIEGDGEVPVLRALLLNGDGEPVEDDINLSERVFNRNGEFVFE